MLEVFGCFKIASKCCLASSRRTRLLQGEFDEDLIAMLWELWGGERKPDERLQMADSALVRYDQLGLLHHERGAALQKLKRPDEAAEAFRRGLRCECDDQTRTKLLIGLAQVEAQDSPEQKLLIQQAAALNGDLLAGAMARLMRRGIMEFA